MNTYIDFSVDTYKMIWEFEHDWDTDNEIKMLETFPELIPFYKNKSAWKGCFGGMSIITHKYLQYINSKYDISKLLHFVTKQDQCSLERIIAVLLQINGRQESLLGDMKKYSNWGVPFENTQYNLPIIKVIR